MNLKAKIINFKAYNSFYWFLLYIIIIAEVPKRHRGKTRMEKVHSRSYDKRVVISMNDKFQAVSDDDQIIAELSNFLGTLRRSVPLTYKSWTDVPKNLKKMLWNYVQVNYELIQVLIKLTSFFLLSN